MPTGFIDLNDSGIDQAIDGQVIATSPACAVLESGKLLIGQPALDSARLFPRWTNNRFWHQLNTDPIPNATDLIRHHADLALTHLEALAEGFQTATEVLIAVPGYYGRAELGLLLGLANSTDVPVVGLVDSGLISIASQIPNDRALFLDISLHNITLTEYQVDGSLKKVANHLVSESGLATLWDRWANAIATRFVQTSRFDPMHQAESEQQLFDRLPLWIRTQRGTGQFDLNVNDANYSVSINQSILTPSVSRIYDEVRQVLSTLDPGATLYVSHRFEGLPGFEELLNHAKVSQLVHLPRDAAIEGCNTFKENLLPTTDKITHVTTLPLSAIGNATSKNADTEVEAVVNSATTVNSAAITKNANAASTPSSEQRLPTHLLVNHHAYPIQESMDIGSLLASAQVSDTESGIAKAICNFNIKDSKLTVSSDDNHIQLNNESIHADMSVSAGDRLNFESAEAIFIALVADSTMDETSSSTTPTEQLS